MTQATASVRLEKTILKKLNMKAINLGGPDLFMDNDTPTEKIRSMLKYFLTECQSSTDCEWDLAQLLLQKENSNAEDFRLVFGHFDGVSFSDEMNELIEKLAYQSWLSLKTKPIDNKNLILISFLYFEEIANEAWLMIMERSLNIEDLLLLILQGPGTKILFAFEKIKKFAVRNLKEQAICLLVRKITKFASLTDEERNLYFDLLKQQELVISRYGDVRLEYLRIYYSQYPGDRSSTMEYCITTPRGTKLVA